MELLGESGEGVGALLLLLLPRPGLRRGGLKEGRRGVHLAGHQRSAKACDGEIHRRTNKGAGECGTKNERAASFLHRGAGAQHDPRDYIDTGGGINSPPEAVIELAAAMLRVLSLT